MKKLFTLFAAMVTFVALNAQNQVDFEVVGFYNANQQPVTEVTLSPTQDLNPYIAFTSHSTATLTSADTLVFVVFVNDQPITVAGGFLGSQAAGLETDAIYFLVIDNNGTPATTLDAATMDELGMTGDYQVCVSAMIWGTSVDPVESNNTACLTVHRGNSTGINEVAEGEVNVYPNPATTVINIDNAEGAQVSVFDINGRMISNVESASANQTIDASNLAKGMYIVRIANGNNVITKKVSVVR